MTVLPFEITHADSSFNLVPCLANLANLAGGPCFGAAVSRMNKVRTCCPVTGLLQRQPVASASAH
jgi:hypothetical protein